MTITAETLTLHTTMQLKLDVIASDVDREIALAWGRAWQEVAAEYEAAIDQLLRIKPGEWPTRAQVNRASQARKAIQVSALEIRALQERVGVAVVDRLGTVLASAESFAQLMVDSQLPATQHLAWSRVDRKAVASIVKRTTQNITAATRPLSAEGQRALRSALVRGINVGSNPRKVAADMLKRTEGVFQGGRARAQMIAATELADAHRASELASRKANADVIAEWEWLATLSPRTCGACLSMHGRRFPITTFGPEGHQACRCTGVPVSKSWAELGIDIPEPPDETTDAKAWFDAQPVSVQREIMGPSRLGAYRSGRLSWDNLSVRKDNPGWRPSYVPAPVPPALIGAR